MKTVTTTSANKYHRVGTILSLEDNVAEHLIEKGFAELSADPNSDNQPTKTKKNYKK